jgi:hypothetical protein
MSEKIWLLVRGFSPAEVSRTVFFFAVVFLAVFFRVAPVLLVERVERAVVRPVFFLVVRFFVVFFLVAITESFRDLAGRRGAVVARNLLPVVGCHKQLAL